MRVSILINCVEPTACHDYAVLWLDMARRVWSRQSCAGIALPADGVIDTTDGRTLLTGDGGAGTPVELIDFATDANGRLKSIYGAAEWASQTRRGPMAGLWRLQAIERQAGQRPAGVASPAPARTRNRLADIVGTGRAPG